MKNKVFKSMLFSLLISSLMSTTAFALDTKEPGDVENLTGTAMDGAVHLTWDAATDDTGIAGYQIHYGKNPVTASGQKYDSIKDVGNVTEYTVSGLTNDTKYYFSVIAYDAAKNESGNWAPEFSATPKKDAVASDDKVAPTVSKAEAMNKEQVKVTFSEEVVLPVENANDAFSIENQDTFEPLDILQANLDSEDSSNKTVILMTAAQTVDVTYKLTVGVDVEDKAGNPMISGTSDTAIFKGSDKERPSDDKTAPQLINVEIVDSQNILATFNEAIVLGIDPSQNFSIVAEDDASVVLQVLGVQLGKNSAGTDDAAALIKTSPQEERQYLFMAMDLKDEAGNIINSTETTKTFTGMKDTGAVTEPVVTEPVVTDDKTPPSEVKNFLAKKSFDAGKQMVELTWKIITKTDVNEQRLYLSTDKGTQYSKQASLANDTEKYAFDSLEPGEYWMKLTQVDKAGNESKGVTTKVILSETGPEMLGIFFVAFGARRIIKRLKK